MFRCDISRVKARGLPSLAQRKRRCSEVERITGEKTVHGCNAVSVRNSIEKSTPEPRKTVYLTKAIFRTRTAEPASSRRK